MRVHDAVGKSAGNCPHHESALFIAKQLHGEKSFAPQTIKARNVIFRMHLVFCYPLS
jgi:hypothetical protein